MEINYQIPLVITNYKVIVATAKIWKLIEVISLHDLHAQLFDNSTEWCAANYDLFGFINWRHQFRALGDTERVVHEIVALEFLTISWQVIRTDYWIGGTFSNLGKPFRRPFLRLFRSLYSPHPFLRRRQIFMIFDPQPPCWHFFYYYPSLP